jgi:uncharacterized protein YdhG (YjbR/CyaY superfamily)
MESKRPVPATIDEYISGFSPEVQIVLQKIRQVVQLAAPEAEEAISYRIPAFRQNGVLVYFAAFKSHIGLYPPVKGDAQFERAVAPYAGEKGNLRFPLNRSIPFDLIERVTRLRLRQNLAKAIPKRKRKSP